jgi:hypothetical protein
LLSLPVLLGGWRQVRMRVESRQCVPISLLLTHLDCSFSKFPKSPWFVRIVFVSLACANVVRGGVSFSFRIYNKDEKFFCKQHYEEAYCPLCSTCNERITTGGVLQAFGLSFHPDHFRCANKSCGQILEGQFYNKNGKYVSPHPRYARSLMKHQYFIFSVSNWDASTVVVKLLPTPNGQFSHVLLLFFFWMRCSLDHRPYCPFHGLAPDSDATITICALCSEVVSHQDAAWAANILYHASCLKCAACSKVCTFGGFDISCF